MMRFDPSTGELIKDNEIKPQLSFWRKQAGEKWYITFFLSPFRLVYYIFRLLYNAILWIFKNLSATIAKILVYLIFIGIIWPLKTLLWIISFGKIKIWKDWLESWLMKIDFWKNRGYLH